MKFTAEEYHRAALERMRQAREIHDSRGNYALAIYCSGLAVECMPRAFRWQKDTSFEGRHDLEELFKASGFLGIPGERARTPQGASESTDQRDSSVRLAIRDVTAVWHNNLRYASADRLRAHLKRRGRLRGIRGDALKKVSADLLADAAVIIAQGMSSWNSKRR